MVTYRDRLARFGIDLLERTFRKHVTTFDVVSNQRTDFQGTQQELAEDLLSVCHYFVAKNNGRRAAANVRNRQEGSSEKRQHVQHVDAEKNNKGVRKSRPDKKDQTQCTDGGGSDLVEQSVRKPTLELHQGSGDDEQSDYEKRARRKRFELEKVSPLQDAQQ